MESLERLHIRSPYLAGHAADVAASKLGDPVQGRRRWGRVTALHSRAEYVRSAARDRFETQ
jgi:hypothetical protein